MKTFASLCFQICCILLFPGVASAQTTVGNGQRGFAGDGGPAEAAALSSPGGLAVDLSGNLYIADLGNQRIRKVSPLGIITTVAGSGHRGFSGDGGKATAAALDLVHVYLNSSGVPFTQFSAGIAVDGVGNLYIADTNNHRIRRVGLDGIITTVAGNGINGYSGDGDSASGASLSYPTAVFVKGHTIYLAEGGNGSIRKIASDGIISTVGDGYWSPSGVAVTDAGDIYISDSYFFYEGMVFRQGADGNVTGIVGSNAAIYGLQKVNGSWTALGMLNAPWAFPVGISVNSVGNVFVADTVNQRLAEIELGEIVTLAGLSSPRGVATDANDNIYVADTGSNRVFMIPQSTRPKLDMDSEEYCSGDSWRMHLSGGTPKSLVHLFGSSNGSQWDLRDWRRTGVFGTADESGTFAIGNEGQHVVWATAGDTSSNKVPFKVSQCRIRLVLDSSAYCSGGLWNMRVEGGMPGASLSLAGISNGESWQFAEFGQVQDNGVFSTSGTFGPGSEGEHSLRILAGSERSNLFRLTISRCEP